MRLIDADALYAKITLNMSDEDITAYHNGLEVARVEVQRAPTVKFEKQQPKKSSEWLLCDMGERLVCSNCHKDTEKLTNFCSYCGAKMRRRLL